MSLTPFAVAVDEPGYLSTDRPARLPLCPPCREARWRWLDHAAPLYGERLETNGAAAVSTPWARTRATVDAQARLIREICVTQHLGDPR